MKKIFTNLFFKIAIFTFSVFPYIVGAQGSGVNPPGSITLTNPLRPGTNNIYEFIRDVINNIVLPIGGVVVVIFIIYSGFLFVTAQGNDEKLKKAKRNFLYVVIGTAILLGAWVIAVAIENTIAALTTPTP